uniref:thiol oxidase n=1 Tax=viral metagenome TaxID=1070528 RepID=A0A6C0I4W6_9ZZZZ
MDKPLFTEANYNSNDGFLTKIWGPPCWHFIHTMSFNYPVKPTLEQKKKYRQFILSLEDVLPCGKCRENLKKNFKRLPLTMKDMENRDTFSRYVYNLHEVVNTMLHKRSNLTFEQVRERYEHFRSRCATKKGRKKKNHTRKSMFSGAKEEGCTEPIHHKKKSKCILRIVPDETKCKTLEIDEQCLVTPTI